MTRKALLEKHAKDVKIQQLAKDEKDAIYNDAQNGGKVIINSNSRTPYYMYSSINVVVACVLGLRLEFNPGELVDFLIGFANLDMYQDDM